MHKIMYLVWKKYNGNQRLVLVVAADFHSMFYYTTQVSGYQQLFGYQLITILDPKMPEALGKTNLEKGAWAQINI